MHLLIQSPRLLGWLPRPSPSQPFCHGSSSKYFWSKFWRRKSKSFVNSPGTSPCRFSPSSLYTPLAASSKHLFKVQPQPFRCGNSPGGVVYVPKSDRERAGQAVSSCGLLCGQNFDGVCVGWRGKGRRRSAPRCVGFSPPKRMLRQNLRKLCALP